MNESRQLSPRCEEYVDVVCGILWNCQVVEEFLRRYLTASYEYIQKTMAGSLPFRFDRKDVENDSMGSLVSKFERFSDNASLVTQLKSLTKHRNICAHRRLALTVKQWCNGGFIESELQSLLEVRSSSETCSSLVRKEYKRLEGLLKG